MNVFFVLGEGEKVLQKNVSFKSILEKLKFRKSRCYLIAIYVVFLNEIRYSSTPQDLKRTSVPRRGKLTARSYQYFRICCCFLTHDR